LTLGARSGFSVRSAFGCLSAFGFLSRFGFSAFGFLSAFGLPRSRFQKGFVSSSASGGSSAAGTGGWTS